MASKTEIANMALSHLGIGKEIANLDTEKSSEAAACRRFFEECRNATLSDFPWPFARKYVTLNLIQERPNDDWGYSYAYPVDCLQIRRIVSGTVNESRQERIPYEIGKGSSAKIILTNQSLAKIVYTEKVTDPSFYASDFNIALSFRLAAYIAPRITQGDPFKLKGEMLAQYDLEINRASRRSVNEQQEAELPDGELIRARE